MSYNETHGAIAVQIRRHDNEDCRGYREEALDIHRRGLSEEQAFEQSFAKSSTLTQWDLVRRMQCGVFVGFLLHVGLLRV